MLNMRADGLQSLRLALPNFSRWYAKKDDSPGTSTSIDPTKYKTPFGSIDSESIRHFRRVEKRLEDAYEDIPKDRVKQQVESYWWKLGEHEMKTAFRNRPNIWKPIDEDEELPYDKLNLDEDEGFGKAMSYVSGAKNAFEEEPEAYDEQTKYPVIDVLRIARHAQVTANGRVFSFSALVMMGTGKGTAGLGYARGNSAPEAVHQAKMMAKKGMISLNLHRGNNIGKDIKVYYKRCFVELKACRTGHGAKASPQMHDFLEAFGITDVIVNRGGSKNKHMVYRALFKAVRDGVRTPEGVARSLGRKLFNASKAYYYQHE